MAKLCSLYETNHSLHKKYYSKDHPTSQQNTKNKFVTKLKTDLLRGDTGHNFWDEIQHKSSWGAQAIDIIRYETQHKAGNWVIDTFGMKTLNKVNQIL